MSKTFSRERGELFLLPMTVGSIFSYKHGFYLVIAAFLTIDLQWVIWRSIKSYENLMKTIFKYYENFCEKERENYEIVMDIASVIIGKDPTFMPANPDERLDFK